MRRMSHGLHPLLRLALVAGCLLLACSSRAYAAGDGVNFLGGHHRVLQYKPIEPGEPVKPNTTLRILPVGDSITVGYLSDLDGGNGDGYRRQLKEDLSGDEVVFAGTVRSGTMSDGYYAAWSGQTIDYISDHVEESLEQHPNIILLMAGTNDMNPNPDISQQGDDPEEAAERLGDLVDKLIERCADAVVLVGIVINNCREGQDENVAEFQDLIPGVVSTRRDDGHHVLAANFTTIGIDQLRDCIHPTNEGYSLMGDYWYSFIHQVPPEWIVPPEGPDPDRSDDDDSGGSSRHIGHIMYILYCHLACMSVWLLIS